LTSWKQPDGTFRIPDELVIDHINVAASLVLVDDKTASFMGIPEGVRGVHVLARGRRDFPLPQDEKLAKNIRQVKGMAGVMALIKSQNV
jgi:hypothetical protein